MDAKLIFTADDYGPIGFINQGICAAVKNGYINSVHVLSNIGKGQLKDALQKLNDHVPAGKTLEIGLHLTLTSGGPLYRHHSSNWTDTWGKMLKGGAFKSYGQFYFGYRNYIAEIRAEFEAQLHQLKQALAAVSDSRLLLTSLSHHHGIFAIDNVLFREYAQTFANSANLVVRSPKALPASANNSFFGLVVPLFNTTDRKEDRKEMEIMNDAFGKYAYACAGDLNIKTTTYTDVSHYGNLGSLSSINLFKRKRIEKRIDAFTEMLERAKTHKLAPACQANKKVIEFVFHLGDHTHNRRGFNTEVKNYSGINAKYFEDRQHEFEALQESVSKHANVVQNNLASWNECGSIVFKRSR